MNDHGRTQELLPGYALGALTAEEAESVRRHVRRCASCAATLRLMAETAASLPLAIEEVKPPPGLRHRVMAAARQAPDPAAAEAERRPVLEVLRGGFRPSLLAPAAVAAALLVSLLAWNVSLQRQLDQARQRLAGEAALHGVMAGGGSGAAGTVTYLPQQGTALVALRGLRAPASGRSYELWLIPASGRPQAVAVFTPDADGTKLLVVGQDIRGSRLAVSDEPEGGSPQPTTAPFVSGGI